MEREWQVLIAIVDTAVELIPDSVLRGIAQKQAERKGSPKNKESYHGLLDVSLHHQWMKLLKNPEKRGRPDILHRLLISILDSPLNHKKKLSVIVETQMGRLLWIRSETRIPRDYNRFCGLLLQTLTCKQDYDVAQVLYFLHTNIFPENQWILPIKGTFHEFIKSWKPTSTFVLTEQGTQISILQLSEELQSSSSPMIIVGGFQKGRLSPDILACTEQQYRIYDEPLSSSMVISRILAGLEIFLGLDRAQE